VSLPGTLARGTGRSAGTAGAVALAGARVVADTRATLHGDLDRHGADHALDACHVTCRRNAECLGNHAFSPFAHEGCWAHSGRVFGPMFTLEIWIKKSKMRRQADDP
jgi:hypothetical protein